MPEKSEMTHITSKNATNSPTASEGVIRAFRPDSAFRAFGKRSSLLQDGRTQPDLYHNTPEKHRIGVLKAVFDFNMSRQKKRKDLHRTRQTKNVPLRAKNRVNPLTTNQQNLFLEG